MAMQLSPPQSSGWHTYSGFDSRYFTTTREIRSLASQEQDSVTIDCQLASSYRCLIQDSNAAVLILRLKTSTAGRDNVKLRANVKLLFRHDVPQTNLGQVTADNVAPRGARASTLNLTSCQPAALKGLPQGQRQSFQTNIEPTISIGGLFDFGLGSYTRGREQETSTNWLFNTFRKSENEPSGYYNAVLLQLDAGDRRSLQSFAQRDVTAAAVLENIGGSVTTHSKVELRTSAWLSGLRCWGRNKIRFGRNTSDRQFTRRDIMFEQQSTKRIESFEALESLLRSYVTIANEQNLPLGEFPVTKTLLFVPANIQQKWKIRTHPPQNHRVEPRLPISRRNLAHQMMALRIPSQY